MDQLRKSFLILFLLISANVSFAQSNTSPPTCLDQSGKILPENNAQVLQWKETTANQFLSRAHVQGVVMDIYADHSGHHHFLIDLDSNTNHTLEVIYNISFGELPPMTVGMKIEACGDYITSNAQTDQYPASPAGAIIHWIHKNPNPKGHRSGYLMINGKLFGQGNGQGG